MTCFVLIFDTRQSFRCLVAAVGAPFLHQLGHAVQFVTDLINATSGVHRHREYEVRAPLRERVYETDKSAFPERCFEYPSQHSHLGPNVADVCASFDVVCDLLDKALHAALNSGTFHVDYTRVLDVGQSMNTH